VLIDSKGLSHITFTLDEWTNVLGNPQPSQAVEGICITIASRRQGCKGGIGFACGVFTCPPTPETPSPLPIPTPEPSPVPTSPQQAELSYRDGLVRLDFLTPIDWSKYK
jgi:hypothetical protein